MAARPQAKIAAFAAALSLRGIWRNRLVYTVASLGALPAVRLILLVLLLAALAYRLVLEGYTASTWSAVLRPQALLWAGLAAALVPVNLFLEISKWRGLLASSALRISLHKGWAAILSGQALGFVTPNRVGEYPGRLLHLPRSHWLVAGLATHVSRMGQLVGTLFGGALGTLGLWLSGAVSDGWILPLAVTLGICTLLLSKFILWPRSLRFIAAIFRVQHWPLVSSIIKAQASIPLAALRISLAISLLRYAVILLQYFALLTAFGFSGSPLTAFALCSLVFVLKAIVPSIALSEMGIRETIALQVMGWMLIPTAICFNATAGLFVLNLLLPASIGMLCVWRVGMQQKHAQAPAFEVHP